MNFMESLILLSQQMKLSFHNHNKTFAPIKYVILFVFVHIVAESKVNLTNQKLKITIKKGTTKTKTENIFVGSEASNHLNIIYVFNVTKQIQ